MGKAIASAVASTAAVVGLLCAPLGIAVAAAEASVVVPAVASSRGVVDSGGAGASPLDATAPGRSSDDDASSELRTLQATNVFEGGDGDYLFPDGKVKADGACPALLLLPFTRGEEAYPHYGPGPENSWAFSHLSAAVLAMEHFNARDPTVVSELASDPAMQNCSVYFPLDDVDAADTGSLPKRVSAVLMNYPEAQSRCAILGPFFDEPALEAAVMSYGLRIPVICHGCEDNKFSIEKEYPNVMRTSVNFHAMGDLAISALKSKGRTDFLNVLHVSHTHGLQFAETLNNAAKEQGFTKIFFHKYAPPYIKESSPGKSVWYAMNAIKESTYRTIFVALYDTWEELPYVADAAEEYGLISPDYVWMFSGNIDIEWALYANDHPWWNVNVTKLLKGAAFMRQMDGFDIDPDGDRFLQSWKSQGAETVNKVKALNPIPEGEPGHYDPSSDYFQSVMPMRGSGYMYDAVIAQGMGACWAEADHKASVDESTAEEGDDGSAKGGRRRLPQRPSRRKRAGSASPASTKVLPHQSNQGRRLQPPKVTYPKLPNVVGISEIEFTGATGRVKFKEGKRYWKNRNRRMFTYGLYNVQEVKDEDGSASLKPVLTDLLTEGGAEEGTWNQTADGPFIFATGTPEPPVLLRAVPEQNFLSKGVHITGLLLMSVALANIVAAAVFVFLRAKHAVLRAAQPMFLYAFAFGAAIMTMSILTLSWDESYGWSVEMLSAACQATPWLAVLGYVVIYCSLFSKLWRINEVLQFRRNKTVDMKKVLGPFVAMVICAILVLSVWTAVSPLTWERTVIDDFTGESIGSCTSEHSTAFLVPLACIMILSTVLAAIMAWRTKDVQSRFAESSWIFYTIFVQLQVLLVGIPVIVILDGESTDASYLGKVMVIWTIPMSTVLLLIGPKAVEVLAPKKADSKKRSRGVSMAPGGVNISGLNHPGGATSSLFASSTASGTGYQSSEFRSSSMGHKMSSITSNTSGGGRKDSMGMGGGHDSISESTSRYNPSVKFQDELATSRTSAAASILRDPSTEADSSPTKSSAPVTSSVTFKLDGDEKADEKAADHGRTNGAERGPEPGESSEATKEQSPVRRDDTAEESKEEVV